jgi:hypothetical protein
MVLAGDTCHQAVAAVLRAESSSGFDAAETHKLLVPFAQAVCRKLALTYQRLLLWACSRDVVLPLSAYVAKAGHISTS